MFSCEWGIRSASAFLRTGTRSGFQVLQLSVLEVLGIEIRKCPHPHSSRATASRPHERACQPTPKHTYSHPHVISMASGLRQQDYFVYSPRLSPKLTRYVYVALMKSLSIGRRFEDIDLSLKNMNRTSVVPKTCAKIYFPRTKNETMSVNLYCCYQHHSLFYYFSIEIHRNKTDAIQTNTYAYCSKLSFDLA